MAGGRAAADAAVRLPAGGRCVAYASDASLVAAGLDDGSVVLLRVPSGGGAGGGGGAGRGGSESLVLGSKGGGRALEDIKFAPGTTAASGGLLACAGHERIIEVHRVIADARAPGGVRLSPVAACRGTRGTVTHLDWSSDGSLLMSNCTAKEALYWTAATGEAAARRPRPPPPSRGRPTPPAWLPSYGHLAGRR